jgi:5-methylcytosine-specific restriction endonuclease McrA
MGAVTKGNRVIVYNKFKGRCAYCGKPIGIKDMQVDHLVPQRGWYFNVDNTPIREEIDNINNLMPSCRRCNHYKRANRLETFRVMIKTLHERIRKVYINNVGEDYGIIGVKPWDGKFYFEKVGEDGSSKDK